MRSRELVSALVIAAATSSAMAGEMAAGLLVLHPSADGALTISGNGRTESVSIHVNSTHDVAVVGSGNAMMDTASLRIGGGARFDGNGGTTGEIESGADPMSDPFAEVTNEMPDAGPALGKLKLTGGLHAVQPGFYSGGFEVSGKATVYLEPGVYTVANGIKLSGGTIVGQGVTFVVLSGSMEASGQTAISLSPPSSGPFTGVTVYQPASNNSTMSLTGGSAMVINGAICAPGARIDLTGNGTLEGTGAFFGDLVVAERARLAGNGVITIGRVGTPQEQVVLPGSTLLYD